MQDFRLPSNNLRETAFELWKPKENRGRQQLSVAPHATHAKSVDKHVRRELGCTPTLENINTDYDPGSVLSTAQSNNNYSGQLAVIARRIRHLAALCKHYS